MRDAWIEETVEAFDESDDVDQKFIRANDCAANGCVRVVGEIVRRLLSARIELFACLRRFEKFRMILRLRSVCSWSFRHFISEDQD
jgi:hypothetical protein